MVSGASPGRLPGPKASQNGDLDMDFLLFEDHAFAFFGESLQIFVCSMKDKLMVLDVKFTSCSLVYPIPKVSRIKSHV